VNPRERGRRKGALDAVMACVVIALVVQMWLLTATLESFLAGHRGVAAAAFAVSAALFLLCGALYMMMVRLDRRGASDQPPRSISGPWRLGQR
jgi:predicted branched-subunit amino acid permease